MWHPPNTYRESFTMDTVCPARDGGRTSDASFNSLHVASNRFGSSSSALTFKIHVSLKQCCVFEPPNKTRFPFQDTALCPHRASGTPSSAFSATTFGSFHVNPRCDSAAFSIETPSSP